MLNRAFYNLLLYRTAANLKSEVSRYYLNYFWWVLEPILTMAVFYVVFGVFLNRGTEYFAGFLLVGLTSWNWFNRSVTNASGSILSGRGLMLQVNVSKLFFPFETFLRDCFKHALVVTLLLVFLLLYPTPVTITWAALPVLLLVQAILVMGISILAASLVPFLPDLKFVITTALLLMFLASGVFYNIDDVVLEQHLFIMYLNPMAGLIKNYREVLIYGHWPDWWYIGKVLIAGLVVLWTSLRIVRRFEHVYPRICQ